MTEPEPAWREFIREGEDGEAVLEAMLSPERAKARPAWRDGVDGADEMVGGEDR